MQTLTREVAEPATAEVLTLDDLPEVDENSVEWRMAYAMWTDYFEERDDLKRRARVRAVERRMTERQHQFLRFCALTLTLTATAVVTTVAMFEILLHAIG